MYFTEELYRNHPNAVKQITAAVVRAVQWMNSERQNLFQASAWSKTTSEKLINTKLDLSPEEIADLDRKHREE